MTLTKNDPTHSAILLRRNAHFFKNVLLFHTVCPTTNTSLRPNVCHPVFYYVFLHISSKMSKPSLQNAHFCLGLVFPYRATVYFTIVFCTSIAYYRFCRDEMLIGRISWRLGEMTMSFDGILSEKWCDLGLIGRIASPAVMKSPSYQLKSQLSVEVQAIRWSPSYQLKSKLSRI